MIVDNKEKIIWRYDYRLLYEFIKSLFAFFAGEW
jgi:hypothetical protein